MIFLIILNIAFITALLYHLNRLRVAPEKDTVMQLIEISKV